MVLSPDIDIELKLKNDLRYIQNDIITKQINGKYCKFSRPLNAVSCMDLEQSQYLKYWTSIYRNHPKELDIILEACQKKLLDTGYTREQMITLIQKSNDFTSEKEKAIKLLGGKYNG